MDAGAPKHIIKVSEFYNTSVFFAILYDIRFEAFEEHGSWEVIQIAIELESEVLESSSTLTFHSPR
jgi:hypothetical protein